jgi:tetratricopeptide (TPR) repeat protein
MKWKFNFRFLPVLIIMAFVVSSCGVKKMITDYEKVNYDVTPEVLKVQGDNVEFTIKGTYPPKYFKKRAIVEMQPVLVYNDGKDRLELDPVIHVGEAASKKLNKDEAANVKFNMAGLDPEFSSHQKKDVLANAISFNNGGSFTYKSSIPFKPEMAESELMMESRVSGKNKVVSQDIESVQVDVNAPVPMGSGKIADGMITTGKLIETADNLKNFRWDIDENGLPKNMNEWSREVRNKMETNRMLYSNDLSSRLALSELLLANSGYEKQTIISKDASIYYAKNLHSLNWNLPENISNDVKQQIEGLKTFIGQGWQLKDIVIDGWASPEGEESFNDGLSERRANTAKNLLVDEIKKMSRQKNTKVTIKNPETEIDFRITAHGPDWNGFLVNVEDSKLGDKRSIMNVIKSSGQAKREQEIRNMILIYSEMEEDILPPLRRAEIKVNAFEPKKSDEEIARLSTTNPGELDVKELLYSATLTQNLKTQLNIYKSVTRFYPNDWRGFNNAAFTELRLGNVNEAGTMLEKAKAIDPVNGVVLNNLGIMASLQRDYEKAESYFKKSQERGVSQEYNLGVLMIPEGDYQKSLDFLKGKNCDYNVGLAQLLSGDPNGAAKNLECAPKTAASYYLLAIVGARTNNTVMMYNNLQKAIDENPAYKETARKDREFINYFENDDFKQLVN